MAGMAQIRHNRGVPAKRGMQVRYRGGDKPRMGRITSARSGYLRIRLEGDKHAGNYHPTWKLDYLNADGSLAFESAE